MNQSSRFCGALLKFTLPAPALLLILLAGCDLGTYSSRYNERVGKMTTMANTNKDLADELIDVGGIAKIRIPRVCYNKDSAKYGPGDDSFKARIPGIEIDGFVSSFVGDKESGGKWFPFQVYFFVKKNGNVEEVKDQIKSAIRSVLKQTSVTWENEKIESYDGKTYVWHSTTIGSTQPFNVFENGAEKQVNLNGRLDLYVTESEKGILTIAFRAPTAVFGHDDKHLIDGTLRSIQGFQ